MCRDVDRFKLQGVFFDHACGADAYFMNREPREFEWLQLLTDGSHWAGHRKLKNPNYSGKSGHLGCSSSFNFNEYKKTFSEDYKVNSQGREEFHATVDACCKSLRLMTYDHFMILMRVFFAVTNLKKRDYK